MNGKNRIPDRGIRFRCGCQAHVIFFVAFLIIAFAFYITVKKELRNYRDITLILVPIFLIFMYIFHIRIRSGIIVKPNSIIVRKPKIIKIVESEIHFSEIEYAQVVIRGFTYTINIQLKFKKENIKIKHIKDGENLKTYLHMIGVKTSTYEGKPSKKLSDYIQDGRKFGCKYTFCFESTIIKAFINMWVIIFLILGMFLVISIHTIFFNTIWVVYLGMFIMSVLFGIFSNIVHRNGKKRSYIRLLDGYIEIHRPKSFFNMKIEENLISFSDIEKIVFEKRKSVGDAYNVYLYPKNYTGGKNKYIFFNIDDGSTLKYVLYFDGVDII